MFSVKNTRFSTTLVNLSIREALLLHFFRKFAPRLGFYAAEKPHSTRYSMPFSP